MIQQQHHQQPRSAMPVTLFLIIMTMVVVVVDAADFNRQVMARVTERIEEFMNVPIRTVHRGQTFLEIDGFPNALTATDREYAFKWLRMEAPVSSYYGLEDGTFLNFNDDFTAASYREPENSGYTAFPEEDDDRYYKHWISCVDRETGEDQNCTTSEGSLYVQCVDNCKLVECSTASDNFAADGNSSLLEKKLCPQYEIQTVQPGKQFGFVPRTYMCVNPSGLPEQAPGQVLLSRFDEDPKIMGTCYFGNGVTPVEQTRTGEYAYCGEASGSNGTKNAVCNPFGGTYRTRDYDPRVRGWYTGTKAEQKQVWSPPYPFFSNLETGITYSEPIYEMSQEGDKKVFKGVWAVDYSLDFIRIFLQEHFGGTEMMVVIVEAEEPNLVIASSTGSSASRKVLTEDEVKPCPDNITDNSECTLLRIPIDELGESASGDEDEYPNDFVLQRAFEEQAAAGFPAADLVPFRASDEIGDDAYISQGGYVDQHDANLKWHVIVVMPMDQSTTDTALAGSTTFGIIVMLSSVGFCVCIVTLVTFFSFRKRRAVQNADWRFTCAFIFGCAALNLSTLSLLGENRDELCMLRMWLFNATFASALSPLFVKVWRMHKLVYGSTKFRRVNITNLRAFLYTLPIVLVELLILTIFSIVDPFKVVEELGVGSGFGLQTVICEQETNAFFYTQLSYNGLLVVIGCVLAYQTRNLDSRFGEATQLAFAMHNIAFTAVVVIMLVHLIEMEQTLKMILHGAGVAWGTIFSSFAFVLPRLLEVRKASRKKSATHYGKRFTQEGNDEILVSATTAKSLAQAGSCVESIRAAARQRSTDEFSDEESIESNPKRPETVPEGDEIEDNGFQPDSVQDEPQSNDDESDEGEGSEFYNASESIEIGSNETQPESLSNGSNFTPIGFDGCFVSA